MNSGLNITGVHITDIDAYNKKCEVVKKLIVSTYPNIKIDFKQINRMDLVYLIIEDIIKIGLLPGENWNQIKSNIDRKLKLVMYNGNNVKCCELCSQDIKAKASCNFCHKICCIECYIDTFKKGKGIIKCGFCSKKFGVRCKTEYIDLMVDERRENAFGK